jgi:hypothetical protein
MATLRTRSDVSWRSTRLCSAFNPGACRWLRRPAALGDGVIKMLLVLTLGVLPIGFVQCDLDDGELEIEFDDWDRDWDDDHHHHVDVWYDEWYDPFYCCW